MSEELKRIINKNLKSLFEAEHGFESLETAFGLDYKDENLTDEEEAQFGDFEDAEEKIKANYNQQDPSVQSKLNKVHKDASKDAKEYYKDVLKKMNSHQEPNQEASPSKIGEDFEPKKRNVQQPEDDMGMKGPTGTGMEGLRYDDEETENHKEFEERLDDLNDDKEGTLYNDMKKAGKKYKDYKYGDKYPESEDEYQETPRVRTTTKEAVMKYSDVIKENIFKTKGKIVSEEQVAKVANKIPSRVKIDETVFAITDGEKYYRLIWEGAEDGEAVITHNKDKEVFTESINKMKHLWGFNSEDTISTKKTVTENSDDIFKKMLDKTRGGILREEKEEVCEECGSEMNEDGECEECHDDQMEGSKNNGGPTTDLSPEQSKKMDQDKDGDIDGEDLEMLRNKKK